MSDLANIVTKRSIRHVPIPVCVCDCICNSNQSRKDSKDQESVHKIPHLSKDTKCSSNKITINMTNMSEKVSPFPSGDHKATMNRRERMKNTRYLYINILKAKSNFTL